MIDIKQTQGRVMSPAPLAIGRGMIWNQQKDGLWKPSKITPNHLLYTWGHLVAQTLGRGNMTYQVRTMYVEFENNGNVDVAPPAITRGDDIEYYNGLSGSATRDYIRIPMRSPDIVVAPGFEGLLPPEYGNQLIFSGVTGNTVGVHGKPFSDVSPSRVYGVAVVASPGGQADATRDIIMARLYFDVDEQRPKPAGNQLYTYEVTFP